MIGWLVRRFRWVIIGQIVRLLARTGVKRSVDQATATIEDKLPTPVVKLADRLPGDVVRAGGAALVASQQTRSAGRQVGSATGRVVDLARSTKRGTDRVADTRRDFADRLRRAGDDVRHESDLARRQIRSDIARERDGEAAALDELLDLRPSDPGPLPSVPEPVVRGRNRFRAAPGSPEVARVQRTYRPPIKPWDRPLRRRSERPEARRGLPENPRESDERDR